MSDMPKHIVIVGGGTAGWMTANLFAHQWLSKGIEITLIESASIGTVGVGEGTTPFIKDYFERIGIAEEEWMPAAHATFKTGISFPNWSTIAGNRSYFHPFYSEIDNQSVPVLFENANLRRAGYSAPAHPDDYFVTTALAKQYRAPKHINPQQSLDYGYHFDAGLLGNFLQRKGIERGINQIEGEVETVQSTFDGEIESVTLKSGLTIAGDFFIDCSGFKGLLIQQHLGEKLIPFDQYLFNDSAVAIQTPRDCGQPLPSETRSEAIKNGWVWSIPLQSRYGNGYVYSAKYISAEQAEAELRSYLGEASHGMKALHLKWNVGRIEQHWKTNCVAIGLSQGFLEPLEAPMLNIIQYTLESFVTVFEKADFTALHRDAFNQSVNNLIDGTVDYLQTHYLLNTRTDSKYWQDCRDNTNVSPQLKNILAGWYKNNDFNVILQQNMKTHAYFKTSWYCILSGMDFYSPARYAPKSISISKHQNAKRQVAEVASSYWSHKEYIANLNRSDEIKG